MFKENTFQIVLIGICVFFALGGILAFALYKGGGEPAVPFEVWGEISAESFEMLLNSDEDLTSRYTLRYTYVAPETFDEKLVEALSTGKGPELVVMSSDRLITHRSRLIPVSTDYYSPTRFDENFLSSTEKIYLNSENLWGLPVLADPIVLYWNERLLQNVGFLQAPRTWDEFPSLVQSLTKFGSSGEIVQATIPFGSAQNVSRSKPVLSSLMLQSGTPITSRTQSGLRSSLTDTNNGGLVGSQYALSFFTEFSDPLKSLYTWNSLLPNAEEMFTSGRLAFYPGFASDAQTLRNKNPNIDIGMALFPQAQTAVDPSVYTRFYGWSITRKAEQKYDPAVRAIEALSSAQSASTLSSGTKLAPAHKSLYAPGGTNATPEFPDKSVVFGSAVIGESWEDPDPRATDEIFARMMSAVESGRLRVSEAISQANEDLNALLY